MNEPVTVFIAYPGAEEARAEELYDLLVDQGVDGVFVASRSIPEGVRFQDAIRAAMREARIFLVLVSPRAGGEAHYQEDEIDRAITLFKQDASRKICPIFLGGKPDNIDEVPFGLGSFQGFDGRRRRLDQIAARVAGMVESLAPPGEAWPGAHKPPGGHVPSLPGGDVERVRTYGDVFHGAALRVDRTAQWYPIVQTCAGDQSGIFLLWADPREGLHLFLARVRRFLSETARREHDIFDVPRKRAYSFPATADAWTTHVKLGLGNGAGTTEELLAERARTGPVMLIFCDRPVPLDELEPRDLRALQEFLEHRLPQLVAAASGRNPVRAIVALQCDESHRSTIEACDGALRRATRGASLYYRRLSPLASVTWEHVEEFLYNDLEHPPPPELIDRLRDRFKEVSQSDIDFERLMHLVDEEIH